MSRRLFAIVKWVLFIFVALLFCMRTYHFVDPDLGWHLMAGSIVSAQGWTPPTIDTWSYTLPAHAWTDHEWLVDGILFAAQQSGHWLLVVVFFTLIALIAPYVWFRRSHNMLALLLSLLASGLLLSLIGVRPQVISLLLFFVSYEVLLSQSERIQKLLYLSPIFFWIWANLHAGFPAGLLLFAIVVLEAMYAYLFKKNEAKPLRTIATLLALFTGSTIATLLTPYHAALWWEIITSSINPLNAYINEWASPLIEQSAMGVAFFTLAIGMVGAQWKSFTRLQLFVVCFFALLYLRHLRMLPFFLIAILPLVAAASDFFFTTLTKSKILVKGVDVVKIATANILFMMIIVVFPYFALENDITAPYQPPRAAFAALNTLGERVTLGNVYNSYGFGGWLIHDRPQAKVFTDGRSPHWRDAAGFSPFASQIDLERHNAPFASLFERFNIHAVIITRGTSGVYGAPTPQISEFSLKHPKLFAMLNKLLVGENSPTLYDGLKSAGWCTLYQDAEAVILIARGETLCRT
jgi:hypothetical protein